MRIPRTPRIEASPGSAAPPTFTNVETHWWDASQLYGSDAAFISPAITTGSAQLPSGHGGTLPGEFK
jgi:hypothetical protein